MGELRVQNQHQLQSDHVEEGDMKERERETENHFEVYA